LDCISFTTQQPELLVGILSAFPFEGFQEFEDRIEAYIIDEDWRSLKDEILSAIAGVAVVTSENVLPDINWNAEWEASFQPVQIENFCAIRASFHEAIPQVEHEIVIDPKMAFGTGHHETTELMIRRMRTLSIAHKSVLDLGCGTGILAILAARLGARQVTAIDNDLEAVQSAIENAAINSVPVAPNLGVAGDLDTAQFDLVLANINRNTLLEIMLDLRRILRDTGTLVLSGILLNDQDLIVQAANQQGFHLTEEESLGEWLCLQFSSER
jgi:ribosomal protein L11 methyltransferase